MKKHLKEDKRRRQDLIDNILLNYEEYADNVGIGFIGPTFKELESYTDEELEEEFEISESDREHSSSYGENLGPLDIEDNPETDMPALDQEPVYSHLDHPSDNLPSRSGMGRRSSFKESILSRSTKEKITKITAKQLRTIIKEEVMNQAPKKKKDIAPKKKKDIASKFDDALKSAENDEGVSKEFYQLVDKAIAAINSGKNPLSVVKALQKSVGYDDGRGWDDDISGIVAAVSEKDAAAGKKLNQALDSQYNPGTVGYSMRHGNKDRY